MATKKPVVPAWIKERVGKTKLELVKLVKKKQSWDCQHAVIQLLSPVTVWKWIRFDEDRASRLPTNGTRFLFYCRRARW